jgi:hypothetical protein
MTRTQDTTTASPVTGAFPACGAPPATAATPAVTAVMALMAAVTIWLAAAPAPAGADWAVRKEETLRRTFTLAAAPAGRGGETGSAGSIGSIGGTGRRAVEVDNFSGAVRVRSHPGGEVTLSVHETWAANSAEKLEQGRREVRLDVAETGGRLRLYVDGPFRSRDRGTHFHGWEQLGYEATFDFDLEVPADVDLVARTVNGGEVRVSGVGGRFDVSNVNGPVTLEHMGGAGNARSVNGPVVASFSRNPAAGCSFDTINGRIEVSFLDGLAADLRFKTLNGQVYTDYDYDYRSLPPQPADRSRGHFHYRSHGDFAARIAGGGPELSFSTINGDILIRRQGA